MTKPNTTSADEAARMPVISGLDEPARPRGAFKDDGDMRLFSGSDDYGYDSDDGGMKLFRDD